MATKEKPKGDKQLKKYCSQQEIKESGFKIAFGISIIIVGIASIKFQINSAILVGISFSSLLFSFIDVLPKKNNLLYIFPLTLLLFFCIYPNLKIIKILSNEKLNNPIVFFAFGLTFCINSYMGYKKKFSGEIQKFKNAIKLQKESARQIENALVILTIATNMEQICHKEKIKNNNLEKEINELIEYAEEERKMSDIKAKIVDKEINNKKNTISVDEIQEILLSCEESKRTKYGYTK